MGPKRPGLKPERDMDSVEADADTLRRLGGGKEQIEEYVYVVLSWNKYDDYHDALGFYGVFRNKEDAIEKCEQEGLKFIEYGMWYWEDGIYQHEEAGKVYGYRKERVG